MFHTLASVDCPLCFSNNSFEIAEHDKSIQCSDCGYILAEKIYLNNNNELDKCIFCGSHYFFKEREILKFWNKKTLCQGCFANYENSIFSECVTIEEKYSEQNFKAVISSSSWKLWEKRALSNGSSKELIYYWH